MSYTEDQAIRRDMPEDCDLHISCSENLRPHVTRAVVTVVTARLRFPASSVLYHENEQHPDLRVAPIVRRMNYTWKRLQSVLHRCSLWWEGSAEFQFHPRHAERGIVLPHGRQCYTNIVIVVTSHQFIRNAVTDVTTPFVGYETFKHNATVYQIYTFDLMMYHQLFI